MANQVSLMRYLQHGLPEVDSRHFGPSANTQNTAYSFANIHNITPWQNFNIHTIQQRFGEILRYARIDDHVQRDSPRRMINSENAVTSLVHEWVSPSIRRSLRAGFAYNDETPEPLDLANICFGVGSHARVIRRFLPDLSFYDGDIDDPKDRANRVPGDIKPSYKWALNMRGTANDDEFRQALSQVNHYMKQHHTRYSFILTNSELVAIRRLDRNGNLQLSSSIPWTAHGTERHPVLTVNLALWYLGMLASIDEEGEIPGVQSWQLN